MRPSPRQGTAPRRTWAGIPADQRKAERRERLLDAAFELLGTDQTAAVRAVCRGAELHTRYFYETFEDVDDLVVAVYDRTVAELYSRMIDHSAMAGDDLAARVRAGLEACVAFVDEDRRRGRILFVAGQGIPVVDAHRIRAWQTFMADLEHETARGFGAPRAGLNIGPVRAAMLTGGFTTLLREWLGGRVDLTRDQLIEEAAEVSIEIAYGASRT